MKIMYACIMPHEEMYAKNSTKMYVAACGANKP